MAVPLLISPSFADLCLSINRRLTASTQLDDFSVQPVRRGFFYIKSVCEYLGDSDLDVDQARIEDFEIETIPMISTDIRKFLVKAIFRFARPNKWYYVYFNIKMTPSVSQLNLDLSKPTIFPTALALTNTDDRIVSVDPEVKMVRFMVTKHIFRYLKNDIRRTNTDDS